MRRRPHHGRQDHRRPLLARTPSRLAQRLRRTVRRARVFGNSTGSVVRFQNSRSGCRITAITPAFQAGDEGSTPFTRSIEKQRRSERFCAVFSAQVPTFFFTQYQNRQCPSPLSGSGTACFYSIKVSSVPFFSKKEQNSRNFTAAVPRAFWRWRPGHPCGTG